MVPKVTCQGKWWNMFALLDYQNKRCLKNGWSAKDILSNTLFHRQPRFPFGFTLLHRLEPKFWVWTDKMLCLFGLILQRQDEALGREVDTQKVWSKSVCLYAVVHWNVFQISQHMFVTFLWCVVTCYFWGIAHSLAFVWWNKSSLHRLSRFAANVCSDRISKIWRTCCKRGILDLLVAFFAQGLSNETRAVLSQSKFLHWLYSKICSLFGLENSMLSKTPVPSVPGISLQMDLFGNKSRSTSCISCCFARH